jgi:dTDP-4-dehydrorhamnose 3,5-epimerase
MPLKIAPTSLPDVLLAEPQVFEDSRGFFLETFHAPKYREVGIERPFVQDNWSYSRRGVLRGLHYQLHNAQDKLVFVTIGEIHDVAVDIRIGSPTFGQWFSTRLSGRNKRQIYVPRGFAHGFCVLSQEAHVNYKCTDIYTPGDEYGVRWDDPALGIDWPISDPLLSNKDQRYDCLNQIPRAQLPVYPTAL